MFDSASHTFLSSVTFYCFLINIRLFFLIYKFFYNLHLIFSLSLLVLFSFLGLFSFFFWCGVFCLVHSFPLRYFPSSCYNTSLQSGYRLPSLSASLTMHQIHHLHIPSVFPLIYTFINFFPCSGIFLLFTLMFPLLFFSSLTLTQTHPCITLGFVSPTPL